MGHYETADENLKRIVLTADADSWNTDRLLAQVQATLAVAEALRGRSNA